MKKPKIKPDKCSNCDMMKWVVREIPLGYGCYENQDVLSCSITKDFYSPERNEEAEQMLYEQCPIE